MSDSGILDLDLREPFVRTQTRLLFLALLSLL